MSNAEGEMLNSASPGSTFIPYAALDIRAIPSAILNILIMLHILVYDVT